jgi:hypothetical protein
MKRRQRALVAALAVAALLAVGGAVAQEMTDLADDHGLASDEAISQYEQTGYASGEVERYQITLTVAEDRDQVNATDAVTTDIRNDYLRIDYNEDYPRELRLLLPREYITPYNAEVGSITTSHMASLEPARNGEFMAVEVTVEGPADIVIPLNKDHAVSYDLIERVDRNVEKITGISPLDRNHEWQYIDPSELKQGANRLNHSLEDMAVQFDSTPEQPEPTWINIPEGETAGAPVYLIRLEGTEDVAIVSVTESPPEIRYRTEGTLPARVRGWVSEATEIPGNIRDRVQELIPW